MGWAQGREVLLLASGPSLQQHWPAIADYIARARPLVLALNHIAAVPEALVDAYVACHPTRIRSQAAAYRAAGKKLLVPWGVLTADEQAILQALPILDYGIHIDEGALEAAEQGCTLSYPFAAAYALCALVHSGARRVWLCGFDGYARQDRLQEVMNDMFARFMQEYPQLPLCALTPTTYHLPQRSIYMPEP